MEWPLADDELAIFSASHAAGCGGTGDQSGTPGSFGHQRGTNPHGSLPPWMNTEIMRTIMSKSNYQLKRNDKDILLFMDNAPCHPQTLSGQFSNITVQVLPKITNTRCQYNQGWIQYST